MTDFQSIPPAIKRPSFLRYMGEHIKVWVELFKFYRFKKNYNPPANGDGHPVLVLPGFMTSDSSTSRFRKFIKELGYTSYAWELGRNYGDVNQLNVLLQRIEDIHQKHQTKVTLIGWSLGGVYARQLAKANPDAIRQVITLCSPFAGIDKPNNAAWLYKLVNSDKPVAEADKKWLKDIPAPAPVPSTALYSKDDGIVPWQACMEPIIDSIHQNVRIHGSHFGMGHNPEIWQIVEDRLRYSIDNWQPYKKP